MQRLEDMKLEPVDLGDMLPGRANGEVHRLFRVGRLSDTNLSTNTYSKSDGYPKSGRRKNRPWKAQNGEDFKDLGDPWEDYVPAALPKLGKEIPEDNDKLIQMAQRMRENKRSADEILDMIFSQYKFGLSKDKFKGNK